MTTIRLALNELRRVTSGRMPLLVTVALLLVPLFYGAIYLVSDDQPDAKLHKLPAALVVADQGATQHGNQVNVGKDVANALQDSAAFDWTNTGADDAADGLRSGEYTFALTLPKQFSTELTGNRKHDREPNLLQLKTNNAQNYLGPAIARQTSSAVRDAVAQTVGEGAANRLSIGFSGSAGRLADAGATAKQLANAASTSRDGAVRNSNSIGKLNKAQQKVTDSNQQLAGDSADLSNGLNDARDQANALPDQASQLVTDSKKTADKSSSAASAGSKLAGAANKLDGSMSNLNGRLEKELRGKVSKQELNKVSAIVDKAKSPVADAKKTVQQTNGQLGSLTQSAKQSASEANKVSSTASGVAKPVSDAAKSARKMTEQAGKTQKTAKGAGDASSKLVGSSTKLRNHAGSVAGSASKIQQQLTTTPVSDKDNDKPVQVQSTGTAKASSYNAGLAPFFLVLAMWVGVFALYLFLRPLSARALAARAPAWRVALGGWFPAALLAMVQAVLVYATVVLTLGITPSHPILAGVFLMGTGLAFTALLHGLGALFGTGGRIAWVALMVLQLFTTPGALPAQTLPGPLHALNSVLPMGYAADGMRQLCYAGTLTATLTDVLVLAIWGLAGLALGMLAGRTKRLWTAGRIRPELAT